MSLSYLQLNLHGSFLWTCTLRIFQKLHAVLNKFLHFSGTYEPLHLYFLKMEELRAHATDWTQNIQNMSMDFRIPVPLDLNDPFQLQRRRRRKRRRGAHHRHPKLTVDELPHGVSLEANSIRENGHLFVNVPDSRYNSASDTRLAGRSQMFSLIYTVFLTPVLVQFCLTTI